MSIAFSATNVIIFTTPIMLPGKVTLTSVAAVLAFAEPLFLIVGLGVVRI